MLPMSEWNLGDFAEKGFYLEEFRGRTLAMVITAGSLADGAGDLSQLLAALVANATRVVLFLGGVAAGEVAGIGRVLGQALAAPGALAALVPEAGEMFSQADLDATVRRIWMALRSHPLLLTALRESDCGAAAGIASSVCSRLKVHKLVIVDPAGGLTDGAGNAISFIDVAGVSGLLERGDLPGGCVRRPVLEAARAAVTGGVNSVSICSLAGLSGELFSYQGTGTLCTLADYCRVSRVGIDDSREVERFIRRGQEEGFLKPRAEAEIAALLPDTWGATVGPHRLAGVCALEQYRREETAVGEVVALCTVSRFKGGGVGSRLLSAVVEEARWQGLAYVFACTSNPQAVQFFVHQGFRVVAPAQVPAEKWQDYDPDRRARVTALRLDL